MYTVSGSFSLTPGFFSPFPHGTGSLSVSQEYLALEDGPPYSDRIPRVPPYSSSSQHMRFFVYGAVTLYRAPFQTLPLTHADSGSGLLPFARRYWGISVDFFSSGYLDVSVPPVRLINLDSVNDSVTSHTGFPHSGIAGYNGSYHLTGAYRRCFALHRLGCQGIHRVPCSLNLTTRRCFVKHSRVAKI